MEPFFAAKTVLLLLVLGLAVASDLREKKIKNWITLPAALLGFGINTAANGMEGLLFSGKGWLFPVLLLFILYLINVMGAGDIKLYAAVGAIMGFPFVLYSFIFSVYIGGLLAVFILVRRRQFLERMACFYRYARFAFLTHSLPVYSPRGNTDGKFAFAVPIAVGTLLQLLLSFGGIHG